VPSLRTLAPFCERRREFSAKWLRRRISAIGWAETYGLGQRDHNFAGTVREFSLHSTFVIVPAIRSIKVYAQKQAHSNIESMLSHEIAGLLTSANPS